MQEIAPGVGCLPLTIENVYFVGARGQPWVLVDAGTPGKQGRIRAAAQERYGVDARPEAIVLTHGHPDHSASARALAEAWDVPVYAPAGELPYLTGRSPYPPGDPTVGGALAMLTRVFPSNVPDLSGIVSALPAGGVVPGLPDWQWLDTPGHSPGHVSFFRPHDRTLLAGDAFTTVNLDALPSLLTKKPEIALPPTPITCDWVMAERSVKMLAGLEPSAVGCGHGQPLSGPQVAPDLRHFADGFAPPAHGRYVGHPAVTDETGIVSLPPPAPDPFPLQAAITLLAVGATVTWARRRGR